MDRLTEFLIELVRTLFERWGYLVIFLGMLLENFLFVGVVVPGVFVLLLAGLTAHQGLIDLRLAVLCAVAGTSLGDTLSYLAGRFGWRRALARAEQLPFMGTVRSALLRRTGLFVLAYHFLGYTRLIGPVTAGALRVPFRRWWALDALGATVWVLVYTGIGYLLGVLGISLDTADGNVQKLDRLLLVMLVVVVAVVLLLRVRGRRRRSVRVETPLSPPDDARLKIGRHPGPEERP
jgi:membrane protein DedA with SNARE-associated domain